MMRIESLEMLSGCLMWFSAGSWILRCQSSWRFCGKRAGWLNCLYNKPPKHRAETGVKTYVVSRVHDVAAHFVDTILLAQIQVNPYAFENC